MRKTRIIFISSSQVKPSLVYLFFFFTMWQTSGRPLAPCSLAGLLVGCMPWDQGVSQEKNISAFCVCFSDQGSTGRHTDRTERGFLAARLARGQGVRIVFQAWTNYWFKLWSPAFSSLILKSVTPSHKTIRGWRGLAQGAGRKWSPFAGIVRRTE